MIKNEGKVGEERLNKQDCLMKIIKYNDYSNIIVEFNDEYKAEVHTTYQNFLKREVKNPYYPFVCGIGMIGNKYSTRINGKHTKEYQAWRDMLRRCYDENFKQKNPAYNDATCCKEWLLFDKFYEWLHSQENFDKWFDENNWALDKDVLVKGNKTYSPETCCLVPMNINNLFTKCKLNRGNLPIGVCTCKDGGFQVRCNNPITKEREYLGFYITIEESFCVYKNRKEEIIKQIAQIEYDKDNITKQCYDAMMNYVVDIND